jgi:hypothetical protein
MLGLPRPESFEDGQRQFFGVAMVAAGVFAGIISVALVGLFYSVGLNHPTLLELCLKIIAGGFAGFLISMIIVIVSMAVGGPVGRLKVHASKDGVDFGAEGNGVAPEPAPVASPIASPEGPSVTP